MKLQWDSMTNFARRCLAKVGIVPRTLKGERIWYPEDWGVDTESLLLRLADVDCSIFNGDSVLTTP